MSAERHIRDSPCRVSSLGPIDTPYLSKTKRSAIRLNDRGFSYTKERVRHGVVYWRCSDKRCKGRAVQKGEELNHTQVHVHEPNYEDTESDVFISTLSPAQNEPMSIGTTITLNDDYESEENQPIEESFQDVDHAPDPGHAQNVSHAHSRRPAPRVSHAPMVVWETETEEAEEQIDVKPDKEQLDMALSIVSCSTSIGVNTESDGLLAENTLLRMTIQKMEMELQRYKDAMRRIRADIDIVTRS